MSVRHRTHYEALFRQLERAHGRLDAETLTAVVGFGAGGPVSLSKIERKNIYVTCELSLYPQQKPSAEGLRFELLSLGAFPGTTCRELFTALGNLSMEASLGHDHTIDVRQVLSAGEPPAVRLELFSECEIDGERFGVYQVLPANDEAR
jgi:hypothetical protein